MTMEKAKAKIKRLFKRLKDFLIAPNANCLGCTSALGADKGFLCAKCYAALSPRYTSYSGVHKICNLCGREIEKLGCRCGGKLKNAYTAYSAYAFELPVSTLIKAFKYKSVVNLSEWMADEMVKALKNDREFDLITCVPMHPLRKIRRGFNQSEILARIMAQKLMIPYENLLVRRRFTKRQASLSGQKRRKNLIHAFEMNKRTLTGQHILIVDDVRTTGTTAVSCAKVLMENGAGKISCVTLAAARKK